MSLVGCEHVFTRAVVVDLGANVQFGVAPPQVVALLKIVAYMDDPQRRRKDVDDLRVLFGSYEATSERVFSDEVFAAELEDIGDASAFLLGTDVAVFATDEEAAVVRSFLNSLRDSPEQFKERDPDDFRQRDALRLQHQLRAFARGFLSSPDV